MGNLKCVSKRKRSQKFFPQKKGVLCLKMPKPKTKKKRFIDPKNERTQTFALIHRSQKDPLAADPDAPQRLLQPMLTKEETKKRKDEEREFGVFYDDEYDYLQHLKNREEVQYDWDEVDKFLISKNDTSEEPKNSIKSKIAKRGFPVRSRRRCRTFE